MNEVRNVAAFHNPLYAIQNGGQQQPLRILAIGDQEGKSPVYLVVDERGQSVWRSVSEVRIIDFNAVPYTAEMFRTLTTK